MINTDNVTTYYQSSTLLPGTTAYFDFCQKLSSTLLDTCSGDYLASISLPFGKCALNANSVEQTTYTGLDSDGNQVTTLGLLYTNTDSSTNNGVESLTVGLICDSSANTPINGLLTTYDNGVSYATTLTSKLNCPIFSYGQLT